MKNAFQKVTELPTKNTSSTYTLVDFPTPSASDKMPIQDFLKIATFPANRDVTQRSKKTVVLLTKPMYKHNEVDIMLYTGETCFEPAHFVKGQYYVLNGNTRQHIWSTHYNGELINNKLTSISIPKEVIFNLYEFSDPYDAINTYYTIDSDDAVEKQPEKITGVFRALNLLNRLESKKIKSGGISTALNFACPYNGSGITYRVSKVTDLLEQVKELEHEIVGFDKLQCIGKGSLKMQTCVGIALLSGKAMELDNRWIKAITVLGSNDDTEYSDIDILSTDDPLDWINYGNHSNPFKSNIKNSMDSALPYKLGQVNDRQRSLDYLSFCWLKYINKEKINHLPSEKEISNSYMKLLQLVWEEE